MLCVFAMCVSVSTTAPLDSNLSEATFGKHEMVWDWKQWKLVPATKPTALPSARPTSMPTATDAPAEPNPPIEHKAAAALDSDALKSTMLKKMGHMGQEVLAELSKLKKRLKHTTELLKKRTNVEPGAAHAKGKPQLDTSAVLNKLNHLESVIEQHVVQADEKGPGPAPQRPARKHTPPHSVQQVIDRYESQEQEEVPVKDFAEGHNWSHEDETNFIFGRQKHHGYNYNRHQPDQDRKLKDEEKLRGDGEEPPL